MGGVVVWGINTMARTTSNAADRVVKAIDRMVETLGGLTEMATEAPVYVDLEEFMSNEAKAGDLDMTDLVFENEL